MKKTTLTKDQQTLQRVAIWPGKYILLSYGMYPVVLEPGQRPKFIVKKSLATKFPTMLAAHEAAKEAGLEHWTVKELR